MVLFAAVELCVLVLLPAEEEALGGKDSCCDCPSQTGEQNTSFDYQSVCEQENDADVTQKQATGTARSLPAFALGGVHGPLPVLEVPEARLTLTAQRRDY